MTSVTH